MATTPDMKCDALVIGGGPCGLLVSIGLQQKGLRVCIVDKFEAQLQDWSKSYAYRIDQRGLALFDVLALRAEIEDIGHEHSEFSLELWRQDGKVQHKGGFTLGSTGYFLQRPALLKILDSKLDSTELRVRGTLQEINFQHSEKSIVMLKLQDGKILRIQADLVLGCDGFHSVVRRTLVQHDATFKVHKVQSPSAGLVYKAALLTPPKEYNPGKLYAIQGKSSANRCSMLPFSSHPGEPRMLNAAKCADWKFFNIREPEAFLDAMDAEYPQINIKQRMTIAAAKAWCESRGSTFPVPQWAGKATCMIGSIGVALVGDSLHSFPPDLGQGVNSGLVDVRTLLERLPLHTSAEGGADDDSGSEGPGSETEKPRLDLTLLPSALSAWGETRVEEAEAICRLIPVGMPYQYAMPASCHKFTFYANLLTRMLLYKVLPSVFDAPVAFQIQEVPPLPYKKILENHKANSKRLSILFYSFVALFAVLFYLWYY